MQKRKFDNYRHRTVLVPLEVYKQLCELGRTDDSFGDVISRLLELNRDKLDELVAENRLKSNESR